LVVVVADLGVDHVGRVLAVLVGGLEGRVGTQWVVGVARLGVVDRVDVDTLEEGACVGRLFLVAERPGDQRDVPAVPRQLARHITRNLGRAPAREEAQSHQNARHAGRKYRADRPRTCAPGCSRPQAPVLSRFYERPMTEARYLKSG